VDGEQIRIWKDYIVAYFKVLSRRSLGVMGKTTEMLYHYNRQLVLDSN